jgi:chromate transporter
VHRLPRPGSALEVLGAFLGLGLSSFGGPIAHLSYFRRAFVEQRAWVSDSRFAQMLALCQFLPGPASSQLGFALGLVRAGWLGGLAAFVGFTLPSALLMLAVAAALPALTGPVAGAAIDGLKLVALAVVAHGVLGMARQLCPDPPRAAIATAAAAALLVAPSAALQLAVVALGGAAGLLLCRGVRPVPDADPPVRYGPRAGWALLGAFALLLLGLPLVARGGPVLLAAAEAFYRAGALVFGGGHVVLPLLEGSVVEPGWIGRDDFLAGYGAAQAVPGPLFSLAAYLGARLPGDAGGPLGAAVALLALFLPGLLLVAAALPLWHALARRPSAARAVAGVNAAVVGVLGAALYDPVWTSAVRGPADVAIALVGFAMLAAVRAPALAVVACCVGASVGVIVRW